MESKMAETSFQNSSPCFTGICSQTVKVNCTARTPSIISSRPLLSGLFKIKTYKADETTHTVFKDIYQNNM